MPSAKSIAFTVLLAAGTYILLKNVGPRVPILNKYV